MGAGFRKIFLGRKLIILRATGAFQKTGLIDVGCGKFACGKQRLGGSILTVAAALRSLSGRFWAGGPTGQQTGQAGQHRTAQDRQDSLQDS